MPSAATVEDCVIHGKLPRYPLKEYLSRIRGEWID
jgi:hypothetical protein